jgi:hypothetical protein
MSDDATKTPVSAQDRGFAIDAHVEGNSAVVALDEALPRPIALLDSSEIIELSMKPSLWFVPIVAGRVAGVSLGIAGLVALGAWITDGWTTPQQFAFRVALLIGILRIVVASLQWASRTYILTNRRVMRLSGVLSVDMTEVPLTRIGQTGVKLSLPQRVVQIGTIRMSPIDQRLPRITWDHIPRPAQVYEKLVRAIRRAQSGE